MVALRATGSNVESEEKAEKRRANSLTHFADVPFGDGETVMPPMYYLFICRIQQGRKGKCVQFAPYEYTDPSIFEDRCMQIAPRVCTSVLSLYYYFSYQQN